MRIYELAKELGLENKALITKANELGMDKNSHSNSLSDPEVDTLRRELLRDAVGSGGEDQIKRTVTTEVNEETGEKSKLVVRRSGNIIRRRRTAMTEETKLEVKEAELGVAVPEEPVEEKQAEEIVQEEVVIKESETILEEMLVAEEPKPEEKPRKSGPVVLGKITLDDRMKAQAKKRTERENKGLRTFRSPVSVDQFEEDSDSDKKGKKGKRKSRVVEFSRGDLVDYDTRPKKKKTVGKDLELAEEEAEKKQFSIERKAEKKVVKMTSETITVGELASQMSLKSGQVIGKLIELGVMATINQPIDQDTAVIVAEEFEYTLEFAGFDESDLIKIEGIDDPAQQKPRPPVVTIMGHVDHGKTSLLDYIRKATVAAKEHGGITQHIGAYTVPMRDGKSISFVDTPGHAAFTEMRARGANITDIVILVVAADDGVMPQTVEALNHAKAAEVPVIVAVNKIDKENANPDRIKTQLAEHELQPEDWGGEVMFIPVSALTGQGVEDLLEAILLVAEVADLKANPDCRVKGTVIEVRQEQGRGTVATVLVQAGTLKVGEVFLAGANHGRVRSMMDHAGKAIQEALPSTPVELTGFNSTPEAGDDFIVMESEARAREVAQHRSVKQRERHQLELAGGPISLEEFAKQAGKEEAEELRVIVKADVHGSLEAVKKSVSELSREEVNVKVLHSAVGGVSESDIQLAVASRAIIVGFNVRGEPRAMQQAESQGVEVRFYRVIYELIDDVKAAMAGLLAPVQEEVNLGRVEVRDTFTVPKVGTVAGCYVMDGTVERGARVRLVRDSRIVYEGNMSTLRRFKDDVKEVQSGYECGMAIAGYNDIKVGDVIEVYKTKEVARTLD